MKFSIIIATYNAESAIRMTLESIRRQKCKEFELLIVDGGSSDSTCKICKEYQDIVSIMISEKDKGLYDAWNKGIALAKGEWILFVGAGDLLSEDALMNYLFFLNNHTECFDYISAVVIRCNNQGHELSRIKGEWTWDTFRKVMNVAHVASLHNRILFQEVGVFDINYKICADYELLLRKRDRLKAGFVDFVSAKMPIGGCSFSTNALFESVRAKIRSGGQPKIESYFYALIQYAMLKTFKIRHSNYLRLK